MRGFHDYEIYFLFSIFDIDSLFGMGLGFVLFCLWVVGEKGVFLFFYPCFFFFFFSSFCLFSISLEGGMYLLSYNIIHKIKRISF